VITNITKRLEGEVLLKRSHNELERRVRQRTTELCQAKEAAERASHAKTQFLAAASHDLRQPLQALNLFVSTLSNRKHAPNNRALINKIESSTEALEGLMNALLDISQLEAGLIVPHFSIFSLAALFERLQSEFTTLANAKGLRFHVVASQTRVFGDPALVERILRNLLCNAIYYTNKGGVLLGCRRRGDHIKIEVCDSGIGIPKDHQQNIFQEFQQVNNQARDRNKGLGLGLAIVDRLARLTGRNIALSSVVGKGSVFSLEIPISADQPSLDKKKKTRRRVKVDGALVLVVEDEISILDGMRLLIEERGGRVLAAQTKKEAFDLLAQSDTLPDLIVSDYRLQDEATGSQVIQFLNRKFKANIPGILITGDTDPKRLREAKESGFLLLHKPIKPNKLLEAFVECLNA
jgi:CheY-like chemotaxis protein